MKQATGDFSLGEKSPVAYFANTDGSVHGFMQCTTSHSIVAQNATDWLPEINFVSSFGTNL